MNTAGRSNAVRALAEDGADFVAVAEQLLDEPAEGAAESAALATHAVASALLAVYCELRALRLQMSGGGR